MAWGSARLEGTLSSILRSLISSEGSGGAAMPAWLMPALGGIPSPNALVGECRNCPCRQAACCQGPERTGMEVHGSLGQSGQGHTAAGSHPSSARVTASPSLLKTKPERSEGQNQLKGGPCPSRAPHCQRISICPEEGLQDRPSPVKPPCLGRKTSAGASRVSM